jgi:hypothetical protein
MSLIDRKICFVTLAIGEKYRDKALTLAEDIRTLTHNTPFVVLTDRPEVFPKSDSLIPIRHRIQSVGVYHDKPDCIAESFRLGFDDCIFLDPDCRVLQNATISRQWKLGLTAKSCYDLHKHLLRRDSGETGIYDFLEKIFCRYGSEIEGCKFINEWIFVVCKHGNEDIFLQSWPEIPRYFRAENDLRWGRGSDQYGGADRRLVGSSLRYRLSGGGESSSAKG